MMNVIVCDDDPTMRDVVTKLATEVGHHVLAETDSGPATPSRWCCGSSRRC